jgi:hypothetical protein
LAEAFWARGEQNQVSTTLKACLTLAGVLTAISPAISYFRYERPLQAPASDGQHYFVVDEAIWRHALPGLQDVRLYANGSEIPYAMTLETGNYEIQQQSVRVLQPGTIGGKTQFLIEMSEVPEYDQVKLSLATKNFVAHAKVEGQDDLHADKWVTLGTSTLFDLSDEKLGHNSVLRIPVSTFKYLRVTVDGSIKPADLQSATAGTTFAEKANWQDVSGRLASEQVGKETIFSFTLPPNVPVDHISFEFAPEQTNFSRGVRVETDQAGEIPLGEISKIHLQRNGQRIDCDQNSLGLHLAGPGKFKLVIENGDDLPLKISGARIQQYERRIYFDAATGSSLRLYYGDEKLGSPVYDYRKFFQKDASASMIPLEAEVLNTSFTDRPDERPWSEQHPAVLWIAIIAAVLVLSGVALRSLKNPVR